MDEKFAVQGKQCVLREERTKFKRRNTKFISGNAKSARERFQVNETGGVQKT